VLAWPGATATSFRLHEEDGVVTTLEAHRDQDGAVLLLSRTTRTVLAHIRVESTPTSVTLDGAAVVERATRAALDAAADGYVVEGGNLVWIKVPQSATGGARIHIRP